MAKTVLIVDDSLFTRLLIRKTLEQRNYRVIAEAKSGEEAVDLAFNLHPDIITLDNILPDMIGIDILRLFTERCLPSNVVMISAMGQQSMVDESLQLGAKGYLIKPFAPEQLLKVLDRIA